MEGERRSANRKDNKGKSIERNKLDVWRGSGAERECILRDKRKVKGTGKKKWQSRMQSSGGRVRLGTVVEPIVGSSRREGEPSSSGPG